MPLLEVRSGRWLVPTLYRMSDDTSMWVYPCFWIAQYGKLLVLASGHRCALREGSDTFVFASNTPGRRVRIFHEIKLYLSGYLLLNAITLTHTIIPLTDKPPS